MINNIDDYIDDRACVYVSVNGYKRNTFDTQICIQGVLEKHPNNGQYRVLVNKDTYTYFDKDDVLECVWHPDHLMAMIAIKVN